MDLPRLIGQCADEFRAEVKARALTLESELAACPTTCRTDAVKLTHILRNLLSNAVRFSSHREDRDGQVTVRARPSGGWHWQLEVEDNGIGIDPAALPHIFEEFYRAPASAEASSGHSAAPASRGLGLAIVRHLSTALRGSVEVRSVPDAGTCFILTFPLEPCLHEGAGIARSGRTAP